MKDWLIIGGAILVVILIPVALVKSGYRHSTANDIKTVEERLAVIEQKLDKLLLSK